MVRIGSITRMIGASCCLALGVTLLPAVQSDAAARAFVEDPPAEVNEASDAESAAMLALRQRARVEDLSARTETVQIFANPDGTWTREETTEPVRALDAQGEWQEIDTTLVATVNGIAPTNVGYDLNLSDGGDRVFAELAQDGKDLAWRWPTALPEPELAGATANYVGAVSGGDLVVTATANGFSYNIVLRERPEASATPVPSEDPGASSNSPEAEGSGQESQDSGTPATVDEEAVQFSIPVTTDGAKLTEGDDGSISIATKSGEVVASTPGLMMWDSRTNAAGNPANTAAVEATVTKPGDITPDGATAGSTPVITLQPDQEFLNDPDTVYPVTVDPTQVLTVWGDTWVQTGDTGNRAGDTELHAGYDGSTVARSYLSFSQTLGGISGFHVLQATLAMRNFRSLSCTAGQVNAARITENWSQSSGNPINPNGTPAPLLNWANQPNHTNTDMGLTAQAYGYTGCAGNWANFDLTEIVRGWANGSFPNYGIKVRANTETWTAAYREYRSANDTVYDLPPKLTITYDAKPTVTGLAVDPCVAPCTTPLIADSTTPDLRATVADDIDSNLTTGFELREMPSGQVIASGTDDADNGTVASFSVPAANNAGEDLLVPGGSYEFRVSADDGIYTTWSAWKAFAVAQSPDAATALTLAEPLTVYDSGATLNWTKYLDPSTAQSDDLVEYQIFRGCVAHPAEPCTAVGTAFPAGGTGLDLVDTVEKDQTTFTDTTAKASASASSPTQYRYWVGARTQADVDAKRNAQVATNAQLVTTPMQGRVRRILTSIDGTDNHAHLDDDLTIKESQPTTTISGANIQVGSNHSNPAAGDERGLIAFNTEAIPAGVTVTEAGLSLKQTGGGGTGTVSYDVHALTKDFDETSGTWNRANTTTNWTNPGGDFAGTALASFTGGSTPQTLNLTGAGNGIRNTVQAWVNDLAANHGFVLKATNETSGAGEHWVNIASGEAPTFAERPRLVVEHLRATPADTFQAPTLQERFQPNTVTTVPVTVTNTSNATWPTGLKLSYRWAAVGGSTDLSSAGSDRYVDLPGALVPGQSSKVDLTLSTAINSSSGNKITEYDLYLDLWTGSSWLSNNPAYSYTTATLTADQREQRLCTVVGTTPGGLLCPNRVIDSSDSADLGLEQFFTFAGQPTGAGGQLLINLVTGNVIWNYDAFANPSVGPSMFARLTYNSQDNGTTGTAGDTGTGFGWSVQAGTLNRLGTALDSTSSNSIVGLTDGDGTEHEWTKNDAASTSNVYVYDRPAGIHLTLTRDATATAARRWTFTRPDGTRFYFHDNGNPTSVVDRNNNTLTFHYTNDNNPTPTSLTSAEDSKGRTVATLVWGSNRLQSVTDISGRGIKLTYGGTGPAGCTATASSSQVSQIEDGGGFNPGSGTYADNTAVKKFRFCYTTATTNAQLKAVSDPKNAQTSLTYYTSSETPYSNESAAYTTPTSIDGLPKTITGRTGTIANLKYWENTVSKTVRARVTDTDPDPGTSDNVTTYTADGFGRTLAIRDANQYAAGENNQTSLVWDSDHNVTSLTRPDGTTSRWLFDRKTGYPLKTWDPNAVKNNTNPRTLCYKTFAAAAAGGAACPSTLATSADGTVLTGIKTPLGRLTQFGYDTNGNLTSVTDPLNRVSTYTYNADGTQSKATDAKNRDTTFAYDPLKGAKSGYPTTITPPTGISPTTFEYDTRGNVTKTEQTGGTPAATLTTLATYDGFGRPLSITAPGAQAGTRKTSTTYDLNDNVVTITSPNGTPTTTVYAADDLPITRTLPRNSAAPTSARTQSWDYDGMRRLGSTTSPEGNRTTGVTNDRTLKYAYDHLGQVIETRQPWAGGTGTSSDDAVTGLQYDAVGNLIATTDPRGNVTHTIYDASGRPTANIDAAGFTTRTRYNIDDEVTATIDQRGNVTNYEYDAAGQLKTKSVQHTPLGAATETWLSEWDYDATGNVEKAYQPRKAGMPKTLFDKTVFDNNDLPIERQSAYDASNAITSYRTPAVAYFEYDTLGRLKRQSAPTRAGSANADWTNLTYYDSGEIKSSTDPWSIATNYKYNSLGLQTERELTPSSGSQTRVQTWSYWPDGSLSSRDDKASPTTSFITDNTGTTPSATFAGTWATETESPVKYGTNYRTHAPSSNLSETAAWTLTPGATGTYRIDIACPKPAGNATASTAASYQIVTNPGTGNVTTNRTVNHADCENDSTWRSLGTYTLAGGQAATITLKPSTDGVVVADAARLLLLDNERSFNYAYDYDGNQTIVRDGTPNARINYYENTYDNAGRLETSQEAYETTPLLPATPRRTTTYTYNIASQPLTVLSTRGAESSPNDVGNLASSTFSAYCYDSRNQISTVTTGLSGSSDLRRFKYTYDPTGAIATMTKPRSSDALTATTAQTCSASNDPTGSITRYRYHETGLLKSMVETNRNNELVSSHYLWFNPTGDRRVDESKTMKASTTTPATYLTQKATYAYTPARQLQTVVKEKDNKGKNEWYVYDAAGNVVDQRVDGTMTNNAYLKGRLDTSTSCANSATTVPTACPGGSTVTTATYDGFGRTKVMTSKVGTSTVATQSNEYDGFDRLTQESKDAAGGVTGDWSKSRGYDPFDRVTLQTVSKNGGTAKKTRFNYLGFTEQVAVEEQLNASNAWTAVKTFNYGPDGRPLVQTNTPIGGTTSTRLYGYNPHGDTETQTWAAGTNEGRTASTYRYTAYGEGEAAGTTGEDANSINPDSPTGAAEAVNPYRFSAKRFDPVSGRYDMGFRDYDPGLNRFLTRDMFNGALDDLALGTDPWATNRYAFAGGNPISMTDLDGHRPVCIAEGTCGTSSTGKLTGTQSATGGWEAVEPMKHSTNPNCVCKAKFWKDTGNGAKDVVVDSIKSVGNHVSGCSDRDFSNCGWLFVDIFTLGFGGGGGKAVAKGGEEGASWLSRLLKPKGKPAPPTSGLANETAGGLTNLGAGSARGPAFFDEFAPGQGFSGVYDDATGSILAFPSGPGGVVPRRGGHRLVNQRLSEALGSAEGTRAGFTAILQGNGSLEVQWLSRSVNGAATPRVPEYLRPAILDALAATSGRKVVG